MYFGIAHLCRSCHGRGDHERARTPARKAGPDRGLARAQHPRHRRWLPRISSSKLVSVFWRAHPLPAAEYHSSRTSRLPAGPRPPLFLGCLSAGPPHNSRRWGIASSLERGVQPGCPGPPLWRSSMAELGSIFFTTDRAHAATDHHWGAGVGTRRAAGPGFASTPAHARIDTKSPATGGSAPVGVRIVIARKCRSTTSRTSRAKTTLRAAGYGAPHQALPA